MRRLLQVDAAQSMVIDALAGETFVVSMETSISSKIRVKNVTPGQLYVFVMKQNNNGRHRVNWGNSIRNGSALDPRPFSVTTQCFVADTGGILKSDIPGTWSQP